MRILGFSPAIRIRCALLCGLWLAGLAPALAQSGSILVRVYDASDRSVLPGATVALTNVQRLIAPVNQVTDAQGRAEFPILRAGSGYVVTVTLPGFGSQRRSDERVNSGKSLTLEFLLGRALEERVQVLGGSRVVDLDQVGGSSKFTDEFIEDLPAPGRFYQDILTLAPGVNDEDGDGNPNVHGARSRNFRAEVGGVSNVDPLTGQWLSRVNADSIEELEIVQHGAGAEFGRAQGGFARVLQKQGTNELQGVVNVLLRSSELDGDGTTGSNAASPAPKFKTLQPSFQVSGPIVKDRLWYRLSHEYIEREDPVDLVGRLAVKTRKQSLNSDQLTYQASPRNKLSLQYQSDPLNLNNLGISSTVPEESSQTLDTGGDTYTLTWVAPYSDRMLAESLLSYQDSKQDILPTTRGVPQQCLSFFYFTEMDNARCVDLVTSRTSGSYHESSLDRRQRLTFKTQATLYRRLWGQSHRLKVGLAVENERYFRELFRGPDISFSIIKDLFGNTQGGLASTRMAIPRESAARAVSNSVGFFVEDQWKPLAGLSLTLGARIDTEEINSLGAQPFDPDAEFELFEERVDSGQEPDGVFRTTFTSYENVSGWVNELAQTLNIPPGNVRVDPATIQSQFWRQPRRAQDINLTHTNLSPRVSLAWDPFANGRTKLSISAGRYYDKIFLAVPLVELDPIESTINFEGLLTGGAFVNVDNLVNTSKLSARLVDRGLRTPYQDEFSFSAERELWAETSVKLTYLERRFRDQLQDVNINHGPGDLGRCKLPGVDGRLVIPSPDAGIPLVDPYTGAVYEDTDPGRGDGIIDDCTGRVIQVGGTLGPLVAVPDGLPDLYVRNPGWGELLLIGNFNQSDYEAFIVELVRRLYRSWELQASYTWSMAEGDAEDFDLLLGNEQSLREDEAGFLDFDQRHVVKLHATTITPWGWRAGMVLSWESGLPYSELTSHLTVFATPPLYIGQGPRDLQQRLRYPTGQRNDHRNDSFWNVDLRVAREFQLGRSSVLQVAAEAFNVLNDDTLRIDQQLNGNNEGTRRFGRQFQLGLRLNF